MASAAVAAASLWLQHVPALGKEDRKRPGHSASYENESKLYLSFLFVFSASKLAHMATFSCEKKGQRNVDNCKLFTRKKKGNNQMREASGTCQVPN